LFFAFLLLFASYIMMIAASQTAAAEMADEGSENEFYMVQAVTEPDGTMLHEAAHVVESLDEQLLIAVRASSKDDVKALLTQGAMLHELAKAADLSIEMKTLVGESLAALYSAQCESLSGYLAYKGSFINKNAPITAVNSQRGLLRLVHADGSLSGWRTSGEHYNYRWPTPIRCSCTHVRPELTTAVESLSADHIVSVCARADQSYRLDSASLPDVVTCNSTGNITVFSKAGAVLETALSLQHSSITNVQTLASGYDQFVVIGTSVHDGVIHIWEFMKNIHITINTGTTTHHICCTNFSRRVEL
jgi:hypothetical protein